VPSKKPRQVAHPRLETQIHRRKKAKALSPLLPEWEETNQTAPAHLRMDAAMMASKSSSTKKWQLLFKQIALLGWHLYMVTACNFHLDRGLGLQGLFCRSFVRLISLRFAV